MEWTENQKQLRKRIIEISYKYHLSHLGSCLTAVDIIDEIYAHKSESEPFILSSGHAGLALYVVLEKYFGLDAEYLFRKHGVHPNRSIEDRIDCSSGSLGHGLPIAVGMALADRSRNVYCLVSDGECSEGSIWEALRIAREQTLSNLWVHVNVNGWGAYKEIDLDKLLKPFDGGGGFVKQTWFHPTNSEQFPFLKGQDAHYHVMTDEEYAYSMGVLEP